MLRIFTAKDVQPFYRTGAPNSALSLPHSCGGDATREKRVSGLKPVKPMYYNAEVDHANGGPLTPPFVVQRFTSSLVTCKRYGTGVIKPPLTPCA